MLGAVALVRYLRVCVCVCEPVCASVREAHVCVRACTVSKLGDICI